VIQPPANIFRRRMSHRLSCSKTNCSGCTHGCGLTLRSTGPATAGQLGPVGSTRYIFANRAKPSCRSGPVTSNVRPGPREAAALFITARRRRLAITTCLFSRQARWRSSRSQSSAAARHFCPRGSGTAACGCINLATASRCFIPRAAGAQLAPPWYFVASPSARRAAPMCHA
jgi:hypothetical protein